MSTQPQAGAAPVAQEYTVRVPKNIEKRYSIMKFRPGSNVDFTKSGDIKIERENNLKSYNTARDIDQLPKFGAGSEFGREQKEEARRKRYGIHMKRYNPRDQPWQMKMGSGKETRRFKGSREGGVDENASYYIFKQSPDGAFEAYPLEEWYSFTPVIQYKYLNSEEAEEEFSRRDKTLNYFSIMLKKRLKNEDDDEGEGEEGEKQSSKKKKAKKGKGKNKDFLLTDMDEWANLSDDEDGEGDDEDGEGEEEDADKKSKKKGKAPVKKQKNARHNSDDEAIEDSDDGDNEGRELGYITSSSGSESEVEEQQKSKYEEKGVEDEDGLRRLNQSGDEDEEDENEQKKQEENEEDKEEKLKRGSDSDNSRSSSSDSDSEDPEAEPNISSALLMQRKKKEKTNSPGKSAENNSDSSRNNSRSATPTAGVDSDRKAKKRKGETDSPVPKKIKLEPSAHPAASVSGPSSSSIGGTEGAMEEAVRRYLMRKPMTTIDLLQKFRSKKTGLSNEKLVPTLGQILKRLNPEKQTMKDKMYLFIKKTE